jgi:methyl-accepting chemotaxis protein
MEEIKTLVEDITREIGEIENEVDIAEQKGKFVYTRSRNIRKSALEISKMCKELRNVTQEHFTNQGDTE